VKLTVAGSRISALFDGVALEADDTTKEAFKDGGIGLLIAEGAMSTDAVHVSGNLNAALSNGRNLMARGSDI